MCCHSIMLDFFSLPIPLLFPPLRPCVSWLICWKEYKDKNIEELLEYIKYVLYIYTLVRRRKRRRKRDRTASSWDLLALSIHCRSVDHMCECIRIEDLWYRVDELLAFALLSFFSVEQLSLGCCVSLSLFCCCCCSCLGTVWWRRKK